jgi:bifunctional non-homologous end joining protein LigD
MSLEEYRRKRLFTATREPSPEVPVDAGRARFVVQLHHARRRHYDFRLQVGDALRSWAVPKGPSLDPSVKRLAAEVEDHPLAYADFAGDIPPGQYGAGHVALFDRGVWSTDGDPEEQLARGHLRFELFGQRLQGGWHLVRTLRHAKRPQWLLFKADDAFAAKLDADDLLAAPAGDLQVSARRHQPGSKAPRRSGRGARSRSPARAGSPCRRRPSPCSSRGNAHVRRAESPGCTN